MKFSKPRLLRWNGNAISDHNRSELSTDFTRIGTNHRTANGTARSYFIADKRVFNVSWTDLPHSSAFTVDNFWGGREIENFYTNNQFFTCEITNGDGTPETYTCYFTNFNRSLKKRGRYDFYDVDVSWEQA